MNLVEQLRAFTPPKRILHPFDKFVKFFLPIIPNWLRPNHFTIFRILATPYLGYLLWREQYDWGLLWFVILGLTDMFDGAIARARDQITSVGIILDPVADKFFISTAAALLLIKVNWILALVVIGFEILFLVGGVIRTSTKHHATDLEANIWGKTKMCLQVFSIGLIFLGLLLANAPLLVVGQGLLWIACAFALINMFSFSL